MTAMKKSHTRIAFGWFFRPNFFAKNQILSAIAPTSVRTRRQPHDLWASLVRGARGNALIDPHEARLPGVVQ